jgi:prophage maintenance system killer protein
MKHRYVLTATEESVVEITLSLAAGKMKEKAYAAWLQSNSHENR